MLRLASSPAWAGRQLPQLCILHLYARAGRAV
jgi:hypothetical protein